MTVSKLDPGLQSVIDNVNTVVASEGGSLELIELRDGRLTVKYAPGVNEECPECVPDHDMVKMMLESSLGIYAPQVRELQLT